jgi:twitching motility two-component system response regulator PilH
MSDKKSLSVIACHLSRVTEVTSIIVITPIYHANIDNRIPSVLLCLCLAVLAGLTFRRPHLPQRSLHIEMFTGEETFLQNSSNAAPNTESLPERALVLLVEDDRALRRYLEIVLERAGYNVISAGNGLEAMKLALMSAIDIVVTDAMMPDLNGYDLCRFLKNSPRLSHLPIVLLSARERKEGSWESEQADAFLSKPVSAEDLTGCLERLLLV